MQDRKRLEEQLAQDSKIAALTSDVDTLLELGKEGEDIAGELERKTLDYLLVCPLSSASILWGKLGARLLLSGLLVSGGAPVLARMLGPAFEQAYQQHFERSSCYHSYSNKEPGL